LWRKDTKNIDVIAIRHRI